MNVFYIHQAHLSHSQSTHFKGQSPHLTTPQYPPDPILVTDNTIIFVPLSQSIALSEQKKSESKALLPVIPSQWPLQLSAYLPR